MEREFGNYRRRMYKKAISAGQSHKHENVNVHVYENVQHLCTDIFFFSASV